MAAQKGYKVEVGSIYFRAETLRLLAFFEHIFVDQDNSHNRCQQDDQESIVMHDNKMVSIEVVEKGCPYNDREPPE
jgi:hypothetical protein